MHNRRNRGANLVNDMVVIPNATGSELRVMIIRSEIEELREITRAKKRIYEFKRYSYGRNDLPIDLVAELKGAKSILAAESCEQIRARRALQKFDAQFFYDEYLIKMLCEFNGVSASLWVRDTSMQFRVDFRSHIPTVLKRFMDIKHEIHSINGHRVEAYVLVLNESVLNILKTEVISSRILPEKEDMLRRMQELFDLMIPQEEGKSFEQMMDERLDYLLSLDPDAVQKSLQQLPGRSMQNEKK